ncbi:hypothetical protein BG004_004546 [Podila humilis]|nr:hypothetical protein BG004_004546 [Podila humilis]
MGIRYGDCIDIAGKVELKIFEIKNAGSLDIDIPNQQSKGFKITRSIMTELKKSFSDGQPRLIYGDHEFGLDDEDETDEDEQAEDLDGDGIVEGKYKDGGDGSSKHT